MKLNIDFEAVLIFVFSWLIISLVTLGIGLIFYPFYFCKFIIDNIVIEKDNKSFDERLLNNQVTPKNEKILTHNDIYLQSPELKKHVQNKEYERKTYPVMMFVQGLALVMFISAILTIGLVVVSML